MTQFKTCQNNWRIFFFHWSISFIYSYNFRQIHRQIWPALIILISYSWKMDVLQIFGSWDQEIDSWFTNHEPLIPTLFSIFCFWIASYSAFNLRSSFLCSDSSSSLLIKNEKPYCRFPFFVLVLVIIIFNSIPGFRKSLNSFVSFFQLWIYQHCGYLHFLPPGFFKNLLDIHGM